MCPTQYTSTNNNNTLTIDAHSVSKYLCLSLNFRDSGLIGIVLYTVYEYVHQRRYFCVFITILHKIAKGKSQKEIEEKKKGRAEMKQI